MNNYNDIIRNKINIINEKINSNKYKKYNNNNKEKTEINHV